MSGSKTNDSPINEGAKLNWHKYENGKGQNKKSPKTNLNFISKFANDKMFKSESSFSTEIQPRLSRLSNQGATGGDDPTPKGLSPAQRLDDR